MSRDFRSLIVDASKRIAHARPGPQGRGNIVPLPPVATGAPPSQSPSHARSTSPARNSRNASPPAAPGLPLIGNAVDLFRRPLEFFLQSYHEVGPIFRASGPGRSYLVLAGPDANAFLVHGGERYLDNVPIYTHIALQLHSANYAIATDGERHAHLRRTLKAAFTHDALDRYVPRMARTADGVVRRWQPRDRLRVLPAMHRLVGEQLGAAVTRHALGDRLPDAVTFARYSVGPGLGAYPRFMARFPNYLRAKQRMLALMREVVAEHRRVPPGAPDSSGTPRGEDFVDLLLRSTDDEGKPFSDADVIANAQMVYSNSLLYGAPACAFLLYSLLQHPDALARARAEVDAAFADGAEPGFETLTRLPLLRAALLESQRTLPIALATPRVVAEPFEFSGYTVPRGSVLLFAVSVCHFLPEVFPNPRSFDIDRYADPEDGRRQRAAVVPYGLGSHSCLGAGLVELFVLTTLAAVLRHVDLALDPPSYTMRRVVNPFPEPEATFAVRVVARR
jgi:cytochrome P450